MRLWLASIGAALLALSVISGAHAADRIATVEVRGTAFVVTMTSGAVIAGPALAGATLSVALPGREGLTRVRLDRIVADPADPEILLHDISVLDPKTGAPVPLCEAASDGTRWAFPLKGQWTGEGEPRGAAGFTLACAAGGALGKCVRWGYKPWAIRADGASLAAYHQACVRMVRADYCGGMGTTSDGMTIDFYDRLGINRPAAADSALPFEAAWTDKGALCVAHIRVPEHISLAQLAEGCPRLKDRLGISACNEDQAKGDRYGVALLFNRSH